MVTIIEALTKKQKKLFATFPIVLYKDCSYYVPSLIEDEMELDNPRKNLYKGKSEVRCFLAYKGNELVGRIAGIINHESNERHHEKCIRFSRIDFIDDKEVSKALIDTIIAWGKEKGLEVIHGPWGFNDADREGMLTYGFDEYSTYATAYSYPYYIEHLEALGFEKESEWQEFRLILDRIDNRFIVATNMIKRLNRFRDVFNEMSLKQVIKKYGEGFFDCYNKAYSSLDNFIPLEDKAKKATIKQFATIINPKFASIIIDNRTEKVVAFCIVLPYIGDALRKAKGRTLKAALPILHTIKHPQKLELALLGVDPDYRNSGAHALIFTKFYENYHKEGIQDVVIDPILTTNLPMLNSLQWTNIKLRAKRQTFKKNIG